MERFPMRVLVFRQYLLFGNRLKRRNQKSDCVPSTRPKLFYIIRARIGSECYDKFVERSRLFVGRSASGARLKTKHEQRQ